MSVKILNTHVLDGLRQLPAESVQCAVTSPPYWGLRDYKLEPQVWGGDPLCAHDWGEMLKANKSNNNGVGSSGLINSEWYASERKAQAERTTLGQFCVQCSAWRGSLGLEPTPDLYVQHMVEVFREVRRVLRKDGTLWLNLGDSYASAWACDRRNIVGNGSPTEEQKRPNRLSGGLKEKDLVGIPWRVAFALQQPWRTCLACGAEAHEGQYGRVTMHDGRTLFACPSCGVVGGARVTETGWWLRSDIIWAKPNPMPESVTDRPTKAHEYLFLMAKAERYYYDAEAIREDSVGGWNSAEMGSRAKFIEKDLTPEEIDRMRTWGHGTYHPDEIQYGRNKRTVWEIPTQPYPEAHFATFPEALVLPCVLAGCPEGSTVLDPFAGSGTTLAVAAMNGRNAIGIELQSDYIPLIRKRLATLETDLIHPAMVEVA